MAIEPESSGWKLHLERETDATVRSARSRDLGALTLVVGMLAVLLIVTLLLGRPAIA